MNKLVAALIGGVIVIGAGITVLITRGDDSSVKITNSSTGQSEKISVGDQAIVAVDACDVLTDSAARSVLGDGAEKGDTTAGAASSDDVSVTNCVYSTKAVTTGSIKEQLASIKNAAVLARSGKTTLGAQSNKTPFTTAKPAGVETVSGYGDQAYFNPETGQLNILKGGNWYIVSYRAGTSATKATWAETKPLSDAIKSNLK